jgi:hypothetical protein
MWIIYLHKFWNLNKKKEDEEKKLRPKYLFKIDFNSATNIKTEIKFN